MIIREYHQTDWPGLWRIIEPVLQAGETYPLAPSTSEDEAHQYWIETPQATWIAAGDRREILGSYYLKPNQPGLGGHVCNCGYMVGEQARGKGVATALCEHSQRTAVDLGYRAMQFNLVVSSNTVAVRLWRKLGFELVGTLPGAFNSKTLGYVDALVMYKRLTA